MSKPEEYRGHDLGPLFRVPKGYKRQFVLDDPLGGFELRLTIDEGGIHMLQRGHAGGRTGSLCLDFLAESITAVREELGV